MKRKKTCSRPSSDTDFSSSSSDSDSDFNINEDEEDYVCDSPPPLLIPEKPQPKQRKKLALPKVQKERSCITRAKRSPSKLEVFAKESVNVYDSEEEEQPRNIQSNNDLKILADAALDKDVEFDCLEKDDDIALPKEELKQSDNKSKEDNLIPKDRGDNGEHCCVDDSGYSDQEHIEKKKSSTSRNAVAIKSEMKYMSTQDNLTSSKKDETTGLFSTKASVSKVPKKLGTPRGLKNLPCTTPGYLQCKANAPGTKSVSSETASSNILKFHTIPSTPRQRVIGLSRRVRPTPLHPYLSKTER